MFRRFWPWRRRRAGRAAPGPLGLPGAASSPAPVPMPDRHPNCRCVVRPLRPSVLQADWSAMVSHPDVLALEVFVARSYDLERSVDA